VHDKQVRRRRAVLGLLVAVSLILLTAYFGESPSSPLHSVQRGIVEVLSPVQQGASKALKPVRDVAGWFSDTFKAKSQVGKLRKEVQYYEALAARYQSAYIQNQQLTRQIGLDATLNISAYQPVTAQVIQRDPTLWYAHFEVDKGSADGVRYDDPVIGDGGLVGKVSMVGPNFSIVTLITDHSMAVAARVLDNVGDTGMLVPEVGNPNELLVQYLPPRAQIAPGDQVVTAGFTDGSLEDLYPAGIPIGTVASDSTQTELLTNGQIHVTPTVDLRHLDVVQVLTRPHGGSVRAQVGGGG
jgi:rod shape-determining protein MreC